MTKAIYSSNHRLSNELALQISAGVLQYREKTIWPTWAKGAFMSDTLPKARRRRQVQYNWSPPAIRALREYMNLTQREMADELEVRQQTISEWETSAHTPHRSMQKTLSMIAERVEFKYEDSLNFSTPSDVEPS
jgi:DNA-binding transcriptional regulator YiaG